MSCSTVGYGDISPRAEPGDSRAFTIFMIFLGVGVVFPAVGSALSSVFFEPLTSKGRAQLERLFPQRTVDMDGDGGSDYTIPRHPLLYYSKNLAPSILLNLFVQVVSALIFCHVEDWDFGSSMYHCLVTATTVGYGDQTITTNAGKLFASAHMLLAVVNLAELIGSLDTVRSARAYQLQRVALLQRELDRSLVLRLLQRAVTLRPTVARDGKGVTELEFVLGMLIELDVVSDDIVQPFITQFRNLDITGDGRLGVADLLAKEHSTAGQLRATPARKACSVVAPAPYAPSEPSAPSSEPSEYRVAKVRGGADMKYVVADKVFKAASGGQPTISMDDMQKWMKKRGQDPALVARLCESMDLDGNGVVDLEEWRIGWDKGIIGEAKASPPPAAGVAALPCRPAPTSEAAVAAAASQHEAEDSFLLADTSGDGYVDEDELLGLCMKLTERAGTQVDEATLQRDLRGFRKEPSTPLSLDFEEFVEIYNQILALVSRQGDIRANLAQGLQIA